MAGLRQSREGMKPPERDEPSPSSGAASAREDGKKVAALPAIDGGSLYEDMQVRRRIK
jgi:hypothetical protein